MAGSEKEKAGGPPVFLGGTFPAEVIAVTLIYILRLRFASGGSYGF